MNYHSAILLVEDNSDETCVIQRAFAEARLGNPLFAVSSAAEAIQFLGKTGPYQTMKSAPKPVLILLDLNLPDTSGLEVLRFVRNNPETKALPVVVFTGSNNPELVNKAYDMGANSYLVKPMDHANFMELVKMINGYWIIMAEKPTS